MHLPGRVCLAVPPDVHRGAAQVRAPGPALVTMTAIAPLLTRQQSSKCSGSAIQREAWWPATVSGSRMAASGLPAAQARWATATSAS